MMETPLELSNGVYIATAGFVAAVTKYTSQE
jgi:hypothetical protein